MVLTKRIVASVDEIDTMPANYREIQSNASKSQKVKQFLEREARNVEYLWKSSYHCLPLINRLVLCFATVYLAEPSYELRSANVLS